MKFVDFFAGIGGIRRGFEQAGMKSVGWVEYDKYAVKSYSAIHDVENEWYAKDVREVKVNEIPNAGVWTAGFPCQDVSIAGERLGFDGEKTKLFYEVIRLAKDKKDKPRYIIFENVKGLLSIDNGWGFYQVLTALDEIGYDVEWQVINTKNFGLPQNRERVFIVAFLRGVNSGIFPIKGFTDGKLIKTCKSKKLSNRRKYEIYYPEGIACCLLANAGAGYANTGHYYIGDKVRSLSPLECFRIQGFTDDDHKKASSVCSNAQLYKQAGNAVSVTVAKAIGEKLMNIQ